jgi:GT2 family glycosyltransferase
MASVDVLIATCNRPESLIMTLAGVASQTVRDLRVIVADQSDEPISERQTVLTLRRVIQARGGWVEWHIRPQIHGIAEQRNFLLEHASADAVLYLDDDVLMEPDVIERLLDVLRTEGCGFVGAFPAGLSHQDDMRPQQQIVERWESHVQPEAVEPDSPAWQRWQLHRAANVFHAAQRLAPGERIRYKVAWVASCILYDREKLLAVGGFSFWSRLPRFHSGEEVLVQNLLMRRWGGCGILPSGTYYAQVPTTILNERGTVDGHALDLLPEMVARYVEPFAQREKPGEAGTTPEEPQVQA